LGSSVHVDDNAGGYGWSLDTARGLAGGVDLLTVVMHEFGHVLGLDHDDHDGLMSPA